MSIFCKNCESELNGNFCSYCGQSSGTHRINSHFLWHDIQHGLLHFDKGILFTIKELFTRPGLSINEFINGKRVKHFKPLSLVILLAGIYGFLSHYYHINLLSNNFSVSGNGDKAIETKAALNNISEWISQHYSLMALLQIPIFAIGTYFAFKKAEYNFIEHLVINSFIAGQKLMIRLVTFPVFLWFNNSPILKIVARYTDIIGYVISMWTLLELFKEFSFLNRSIRTILSLAISLIIIYIVLVITGAIYLR